MFGPTNTSEEVFRGSKHLLTRYLGDFGRLGLQPVFLETSPLVTRVLIENPNLLNLMANRRIADPQIVIREVYTEPPVKPRKTNMAMETNPRNSPFTTLW